VIFPYKLPNRSPERQIAFKDRMFTSTVHPARTANCAAEALVVLEQLRSMIHINVASDLQVGLTMLRSCLRGAIANMRTNLTSVSDPEIRIQYEDMITGWEQVLREN
jgi:formiminotetrahydrofolate cyclodeaminase